MAPRQLNQCKICGELFTTDSPTVDVCKNKNLHAKIKLGLAKPKPPRRGEK